MNFLIAIFAVMLLESPDVRVDSAAAAAVSKDADRVAEVGATGEPAAEGGGRKKEAHIRSRTSDFDRGAGVSMFEGNVVVEYSGDCTLWADRLYAFAAKSNKMSRVVAIGNVVISNETRLGRCEMATYRRKLGEIEMFGGADGKKARLVETAGKRSELEGSRIRFWLDSEQVEVEQSGITTNERSGI